MDKTDPICGMKGTIPAHGHYFCCEHCIKKYEEQHGISEEKKYCSSCYNPTDTWLFYTFFKTVF